MIPAIILAAGLGSRLGGRGKAVEKLGATSLLERTCTLLRESGVVDRVTVVTGAHRDEVKREAERLELATVHNGNFIQGAMGSLQTGLASIAPASREALITLVDLPLIRPETVRALTEGFFARRSEKSLARIRYAGGPGHPCILGREHFSEIAREPPSDRGAAFLFRKYPEAVYWFETDDSGVTRDFDSAEDFEAFRP